MELSSYPVYPYPVYILSISCQSTNYLIIWGKLVKRQLIGLTTARWTWPWQCCLENIRRGQVTMRLLRIYIVIIVTRIIADSLCFLPEHKFPLNKVELKSTRLFKEFDQLQCCKLFEWPWRCKFPLQVGVRIAILQPLRNPGEWRKFNSLRITLICF